MPYMQNFIRTHLAEFMWRWLIEKEGEWKVWIKKMDEQNLKQL